MGLSTPGGIAKMLGLTRRQVELAIERGKVVETQRAGNVRLFDIEGVSAIMVALHARRATAPKTTEWPLQAVPATGEAK